MWPFARRARSPGGPAYGHRFAREVRGERWPLFPVLMRPDWPDADAMACRPMVPGKALPGIPWVALAHLGPGAPAPARAFVPRAAHGGSAEGMQEREAEALHNLALRPVAWRTADLAPGTTMAGCDGDFLAAERILVPAFLAEAGRLLGDDTLVVGIPARGQIYAMTLARLGRGDSGRAFRQAIGVMHGRAGEGRITASIFLVVGGELASVLELDR